MASVDTPIPQFGSKTGPQSGVNRNRIPSIAGVPITFQGTDGSFTPGIRRLLAASSFARQSGIPCAPTGSFETYREILTDPTVQLGRAVVFGPILASDWTYQARDSDTPSEMVDFARNQFQPLEASLKVQLLRSLDFGFRGFEQNYEPFDDPISGRVLVGIESFKPLRPEFTQVLVDPDSGDYIGIRNGDVELLPEETLLFTHDMEDDDYYGRSRLENVRERAWWPHVCLEKRLGQLAQKISQIIPIVKGPLSAREKDMDGNDITGFDAAQTVLNALVYGDGVMVENLAAAIDDIAGSPDLAKLSKWDISQYDTGQSSGGITGLIEGLKYYDALKMRGMLRPERTATEGQHGTKAEVAEQADVGLAEGQLLHLMMCQCVNWHSLNRLLVWNFGPGSENMVRIVPTPLIDEKKAVFRWLFQTLLANPAVLDLVVANLDLDSIADGLAVPTLNPLNVGVDPLVKSFVPPGGATTGAGGVVPPIAPLNAENAPIAASRSRRSRRR